MGADGILKLADSNVRTEWNGTAGGTFANDVVFTGNQVFATKDFTFSGDLSGTAFSTQGAGNITLAGGVNLDGQLKVHRGTVTVNSADVAKLGTALTSRTTPRWPLPAISPTEASSAVRSAARYP